MTCFNCRKEFIPITFNYFGSEVPERLCDECRELGNIEELVEEIFHQIREEIREARRFYKVNE